MFLNVGTIRYFVYVYSTLLWTYFELLFYNSKRIYSSKYILQNADIINMTFQMYLFKTLFVSGVKYPRYVFLGMKWYQINIG